METPLHLQQGQTVTGELRLAAHSRQSYDVFVTLSAPPLHPGLPAQQVHSSTPNRLESLIAKGPHKHKLDTWSQYKPACQKHPSRAYVQEYVPCLVAEALLTACIGASSDLQ